MARKKKGKGKVKEEKHVPSRKKRFQYTQKAVTNALEDVNGGQSFKSVSEKYNVPLTTLRNKFYGFSPTYAERSGKVSWLGPEVEKKIVDWVIDCARRGFPIIKEDLFYSVKKLVEEYKLETPFVENKPSEKWYKLFLKRHPEISLKKSEYLNKAS